MFFLRNIIIFIPLSENISAKFFLQNFISRSKNFVRKKFRFFFFFLMEE